MVVDHPAEPLCASLSSRVLCVFQWVRSEPWSAAFRFRLSPDMSQARHFRGAVSRVTMCTAGWMAVSSATCRPVKGVAFFGSELAVLLTLLLVDPVVESESAGHVSFFGGLDVSHGWPLLVVRHGGSPSCVDLERPQGYSKLECGSTHGLSGRGFRCRLPACPTAHIVCSWCGTGAFDWWRERRAYCLDPCLIFRAESRPPGRSNNFLGSGHHG